MYYNEIVPKAMKQFALYTGVDTSTNHVGQWNSNTTCYQPVDKVYMHNALNVVNTSGVHIDFTTQNWWSVYVNYSSVVVTVQPKAHPDYTSWDNDYSSDVRADGIHGAFWPL